MYGGRMPTYFFSSSGDEPQAAETPLPREMAHALKFAGKITQELLLEFKRNSERLDALVRDAAQEGFSAGSIAASGLSRNHVARIIAGEDTWAIAREP